MDLAPVLPRKRDNSRGYIPQMIERINLLSLYPQLSGRPKMVRCPEHDDSTPSLAIYESNTHCMGGDCPLHETAIQHIWRVFQCGKRTEVEKGLWLSNWPKFFYYARRIVQKDVVLITEEETPPPLDVRMPVECNLNLMRDAAKLGWLNTRYGLSNQTISDACLGHTNRRAFTLPVYSLQGDLVTVRFRRDDNITTEGAKYFALKGYGDTCLYIPPCLRGEGRLSDVLPKRVLPGSVTEYGKKVTVLTEGEFDALALCQVGVPAVSFTNGCKALLEEGSRHASVLRGLDAVWVAYDQDGSGQADGARVVDLLESVGIPAYRVRWNPELGKDASEMIAKHRMSKYDIQSAWTI